MSVLRKLTSVTLLLGMFATACSDDKDSKSADDTSSSMASDSTSDSSTSSESSEATDDTDPGTIVDVATEAGTFATLLQAAQTAGLVDTLNGEGPFTVFAPTDDAFAALPEGALDDLIADPEALKDVLLYHVVQGAEVTAEEVVDMTSAEMANGETVSIKVVDGKVVLNDDVNVTSTDIAASNGVIHVIDAVLLPPTE